MNKNNVKIKKLSSSVAKKFCERNREDRVETKELSAFGYPGYTLDSTGTMVSHYSNGSSYVKKRITSTKGYILMSVKNGKKISLSTLMGLVFVEGFSTGDIIKYKDNNKQNLNVDNLIWIKRNKKSIEHHLGYKIRSLGTIGFPGYTLDTNGVLTSLKGKLKIRKTKPYVSLRNNIHENVNILFANLMAKVFFKSWNGKDKIGFKDGDKNNFKLRNLFVITPEVKYNLMLQRVRKYVADQNKKGVLTKDLISYGYPGYSINECAEVVSFRATSPKLKQHLLSKGFASVTIGFDPSVAARVSLSRLMGIVFLKGYKEGMYVKYKDGDQSNIKLNNLFIGNGLKGYTQRINSFISDQKKKGVTVRHLYKLGYPGYTIDNKGAIHSFYNFQISKVNYRLSKSGKVLVSLKKPKTKLRLNIIESKNEVPVSVKKLMGEIFLQEYKRGRIISHKDNNPMNFDLENLFVSSVASEVANTKKSNSLKHKVSSYIEYKAHQQITNKGYKIFDLSEWGYEGYTLDTTGEVMSFRAFSKTKARPLNLILNKERNHYCVVIPKTNKVASRVTIGSLFHLIFHSTKPRYKKILYKDNNNKNVTFENIYFKYPNTKNSKIRKPSTQQKLENYVKQKRENMMVNN